MNQTVKTLPEVTLFKSSFYYSILKTFRLFEAEGIPKIFHLLLCMTFLWGIVFILALIEGVAFPTAELKIPMIFDIPLYFNIFFGIPLFIYGFFIFEFSLNGFINWIPRENRILINHDELYQLVSRLKQLCTKRLFEYISLIIAITTILGWILPEFTNSEWTWPTRLTSGNIERPTIAGLFAIVYYIFLNYLMYSFIFKAIFWTWFLFKLSKKRLIVNPIHPDQCGGFNPINLVQKTYGFPVSAIGFIVCGAILNNILFLDAPITRIDHLLMLIGFGAVVPILFFLPLNFFRNSLWLAKKKASAWIDSIANLTVDNIIQIVSNATQKEILDRVSLFETVDFVASYRDRIINMRILPFDFKSLKSFFGMAYAPLLSLILPFFPTTLQKIFGIFVG